MYAIDINGEIKKYNRLPKSWGNIIGGFDILSNEEVKKYGFYDIEIPTDYNERTHSLSDIYFDETNDVFKRDLINLTWTKTLNELKSDKINNFKNQVKGHLNQTDWYVIRNVERGIDIPQNIKDERSSLLSQIQNIESEINALATKKQVVLYQFPII